MNENPTEPLPPTSADADATTSPSGSRRRWRPWVIGGASAVAAAVLVGGGVAIGGALNDDDRVAFSEAAQQGAAAEPGATTPDATPGAAPAVPTETAPVASAGGAASADELIGVARAAAGVAEGAVTSIDARRDGSWEVHLETEAGDESEVHVAADGTATVTEFDRADGDDRGPRTALDDAALEALVAAALGHTPGAVIDVSADDDDPYDVTVLAADGQRVDLDIDASFAVVGVDLDD